MLLIIICTRIHHLHVLHYPNAIIINFECLHFNFVLLCLYLIVENVQEDVLCLRARNEPWTEVISKWQATFSLRRKQTLSDFGTVFEIISQWPILNNPRAYTLV